MYRRLCSGQSDGQTHSWKKTPRQLRYFVQLKPVGTQPWCLLKAGFGLLLLKPHCFLETHCAHLFQPSSSLHSGPCFPAASQALAQHSCLMEIAVSLLLKLCAQCEMGVLGTDRCIADTTDKAKGFGDISCLLKGMARKRATPFPLKCLCAGNKDMQPESSQ